MKRWEGIVIKILMATFWLIPHVGGVWKFMDDIQHYLEAMGHEVDILGNSHDYSKFIIHKKKEISKEHLAPMLEAKLGVNVGSKISPDPFIDFYERDRYMLELAAAYFGLDQYDVIHTQDIFSTRALGRVKPKNKPLLAHFHGSVSQEFHNHFNLNPQLGITELSDAWRYFPSLEYYASLTAYPVITANQWQKNKLVHELYVPEERVQVFQYGLDQQKFWNEATVSCEMQKPSGKKVIICPARLVFVKGIDVLISALGLLKAQRQDWVCWIVGDGNERSRLEQQVANLGLQNDILFLGERQDVPALLMRSDIFVHSCLQDNQPFSVMEAQIAGLALCVSSAGGLPEMVEHGVTGLVSPVKDFVTLSQHLQLLLEQDELRVALGNNGKVWAQEHWSMDNMIHRLLGVYSG